MMQIHVSGCGLVIPLLTIEQTICFSRATSPIHKQMMILLFLVIEVDFELMIIILWYYLPCLEGFFSAVGGEEQEKNEAKNTAKPSQAAITSTS